MEYGNNYGDNNYVQQQQPACTISPSSVLVFGILSMVFSGLLGFIFGIVGLSKAKNFIAVYGPISGQVNAGRILSILGMIGSILSYFICLIFAIYLNIN